MSTRRYAADNKDEPRSCVVTAGACLYTALTTECGCRVQEECLCLQRSFCCEPGIEPLTIGLDTAPLSHEYCKIGVGFCEVALIPPRTLCATGVHSLCLRGAAALPLHEDYLEDAVCAYYCIQCYPHCDCAAQAPRCPALERMKRRRGALLGNHEPPVVQAVAMDERMDDDNGYVHESTNDLFQDEEEIPMAEAQMVEVLPVTTAPTAPYEDNPSSAAISNKNM